MKSNMTQPQYYSVHMFVVLSASLFNDLSQMNRAFIKCRFRFSRRRVLRWFVYNLILHIKGKAII
jgi:hypothetical protein